MRSQFATAALLGLIPLAACSPGAPDEARPRAAVAAPDPSPAVAATAAPAPPAVARRPLVVFLGDSLTAGLGLDREQAFPALLARRLAEQGEPVRVENAGVSGDTTAGGLARLDWLLKQRPDVLVVGLGANDGLRGLPVEEADRNLRAIVRRAKAAGARVLLLGMRIPPNYGPDYTRRFAAIYPRIAKDFDLPLVPFVLAGVGGVADLNQADGIHPNVEGEKLVAANVFPYLRPLVEQVAAGKTTAGRRAAG
jgi:acyl-CoA thioesterase I